MILVHNGTAHWHKCENFHLEYQKTNMPPKNDIQIYHSQKEAKKAGWKIIKGKLLCPKCSLKETERCPNCGKLYPIGKCNHSSTIKTLYGFSCLYGVCKECAEIHSRINKGVMK